MIKTDDVYINLEVYYYGMMTEVDAHADSLVDSPKPQAYFSKITGHDDVTFSQEIVEPRTYAHAVHPSNTCHREWQSMLKRKLIPSQKTKHGLLFSCLLKGISLDVCSGFLI